MSNYAQYCSIVKTGVGNIDMVIGGEVDCSTLSTNPISPHTHFIY